VQVTDDNVPTLRQQVTERTQRQVRTKRRSQKPSPRRTATTKATRKQKFSLIRYARQNPFLSASLATLLLTATVIAIASKSGWSPGMPLANSQPAADGSAAQPAAVAQPDAASGVQQQAVPTAIPTSLVVAEQDTAARRQKLQNELVPFLQKYCLDCHNQQDPGAGISVEGLDSLDDLLTKRKSWERVYRMVNAGAMPPFDHDPRPNKAEQLAAAEFLYSELYDFDCTTIDNPGHPTIQRLNRAEYNNTIRDLFGISITPADDFPSDDVGEGFDNIGDVLSLPPLLLEKYLNAAEQVTDVVMDATNFGQPQTMTVAADRLTSTLDESDQRRGFRMLMTEGELFAEFEVISPGQYKLQTEVYAEQAGDEKVRLALKVDGQVLNEHTVEDHRRPRNFEQQIELQPGQHRLAVAYLNNFCCDDDAPADRRDRNLGVKYVRLHGPLNPQQPVYRKSFTDIVVARPGDGVSVRDAAKQVFHRFLPKAFRRPVTDAEVDRYAGLVQSTVDDMQEPYEAALSLALQAVLISPDFLFRIEKDPEPGQQQRPLDDFEIASRLSYFLWSSMPDEELFQLAAQQQLHKPEVLTQQVRRMLQDEKSAAMVSNFAAQWLNLRNLDEVSPNPDVFKNFDQGLRDAMRRETELLFESVMKEDRSVEDLLSADFTFVNQRLADHYGLQGLQGEEFQRVSLQGSNRAGVLTHASILTLTSNPARTSPVKRGKWIMENIFGEAPPPAPPGVPELEVTAQASPDATLREQLAKHREDPGCASCHDAMDPLGLGFENFDAIGRWRDSDDGKPIDASGTMPSGQSFDGPLQLIGIVKNQKHKFFRTMAEKMLIYAIGRGLDYYDKCAVDECLKRMEQRGQRFSALIEGVVLSDAFLKRSVKTPQAAAN
jgi:hypothetical protein